MGNAFSKDEEKLEVQQVLEKRENELIYIITKELLKYHFSNDEQEPQFHKFNQLKEIVTYWYHEQMSHVGNRSII